MAAPLFAGACGQTSRELDPLFFGHAETFDPSENQALFFFTGEG